MSTVIQIEDLWKEYRLGTIGHRLLYRDLQSWWAKVRGQEDPNLRLDKVHTGNRDEHFWALQGVSLEVKEGDVLGIIGRNGAGKSTMLKILSRITSPTRGQIKIKGRISSLLEVGTGFHQELTGRENIFLNGAILGMRRKEIAKKLDEIVAFAEIEKFLDTPVKRYSSGMYVRLAFAVAAHLEPEILIVDEVLAVGDYDFQNKCLGKMQEVSKSGRTVLFVSHNMGTVQHLCTRAVLLENGKVVINDTPAKAVSAYLLKESNRSGERTWPENEAPRFPDRRVALRAIRLLNSHGEKKGVFDVKETIQVEVEYQVFEQKHCLNTHLYFRNQSGQNLFVAMDHSGNPWLQEPPPPGVYRGRCILPDNFLNEGSIRIEYLICTRPTGSENVSVLDAISFEVTDDKDPSGARGIWSRDWPEAAIRPAFPWQVEKIG